MNNYSEGNSLTAINFHFKQIMPMSARTTWDVCLSYILLLSTCGHCSAFHRCKFESFKFSWFGPGLDSIFVILICGLGVGDIYWGYKPNLSGIAPCAMSKFLYAKHLYEPLMSVCLFVFMSLFFLNMQNNILCST